MGQNFTPKATPGQTIDPRAPSTDWAVAGIIAGGASVFVFGGAGAVFQIANTKTGYSWPYVFLGVGISLGMKAGASISSPSWTLFTTPRMVPDDFDSWGSIKGGEITFLGGGALSWINIYSVDHVPNPIDVGGTTVGIQLGAGWTPGRFFLIESLGEPDQQTATAAKIENALRAKIGAKALAKYIR